MSFYGYICVYSKSTTPFDFACLREILKIIGPASPSDYEIYRSRKESEEWKELQRYLELQNHYIFKTITPEMEEEYNNYCFEDEISEVIPKTSSFEEAIGHYIEGGKLAIHIYDTSLGDSIDESLMRNIPETLSDRFRAGSVSIQIGEHDLCEAMSGENGLFFARTFFSLRIGGYGAPNDWDQMREEIAKLPEIKKLCQDISQIVGPVGVCSFWDG
jgi:hypothetical protein